MAKFYSTCSDVGQFLLCSWEHQLGHEWPRRQSWGDPAALYSAIDTRTSFSWSKMWCVTLGRAKPCPEAFYVLGAQSPGTASVLVWFLEFTNQNLTHILRSWKVLPSWDSWKVVALKKQSDHRAALREGKLSQRVCSSLGQKCSPDEEISQCQFNLSPVLVTVLILVSVSAHISQWLLLYGNNH